MTSKVFLKLQRWRDLPFRWVGEFGSAPTNLNFINSLSLFLFKVELALSVEALMPKLIRRNLIRKKNEVYPNRKFNPWEYFRFKVLSIDRYDSPDKISSALNPVQVYYV